MTLGAALLLLQAALQRANKLAGMLGGFGLRHWRELLIGMLLAMVWLQHGQIQRGVARSACLIHAANWPHQLQGCIGIGRRLASMPPHGPGITDSRETLQRLCSQWGDRRSLSLSIQWGRDDRMQCAFFARS